MAGALSARGMRIAVIDFKADGVSKSMARKISELIRNDLINSGKIVVVERSQMDQILKEQGLQASGCTDTECAVQLGKLLSARKMLIGTIMSFNGRTVISGRIVDVEKGTAEISSREIVRNKNDLIEGASQFTRKLSRQIENGKTEQNYSENNTFYKNDFWNKWHLVIMPAALYEESYQVFGLSISTGIEIGKFYTGFHFDYIPEQRAHNIASESPTSVTGYGCNFSYRLLSMKDIFTVSPGVFVGYFHLKQYDYFDIVKKLTGYFGPLLKLEVGYWRFHFFTEILPVFGTREYYSSGIRHNKNFGYCTLTVNMGVKMRFYSF